MILSTNVALRFRTYRDERGFTDLGFMLPDHIRFNDGRIPVPNRVAIKRLEIKQISLGVHEIESEVKKNRSLWYNLCLYYGIDRNEAKKVENESDFLNSMKNSRVVLVPIRYGRTLLNSWVKEPVIKTKDGQFDAGGKIDIQCVTLFEKQKDKEYQPRLVMHYNIRRNWGRGTLEIVEEAINEFLKHVETGFKVEVRAVKFPFQGGSASGK